MGWRTEPTAELPILGRIDLTEAYAAVRRRGDALRRRRIISGILAGVLLAGVFTIVGVYYVTDIPLPDALRLPQTTTVYYSDGVTVMARLGEQNRISVDPASLPEYVPAAVVAAEDPGFYDNNGTSISRQYVRIAAGLDHDTLSGQARELVLASKLEDEYSKRDILGFYLNTVYFGRGAYGIGAAAEAYFGRGAQELDRAQAVVLAGVLQSPGDGRYDPTMDAAGAADRFRQVVQGMKDAGSLDPGTADGLSVPAVRPYDPGAFESGLDAPTGLVVAHVLAELRAMPAFRGAAPGTIENGGYAIVTTIDVKAQHLLESTADQTVATSVMQGQPDNLQAAAVVVEPGTGRVRAYFGGHDGTGADFAGWYTNGDGEQVGYGEHPPGQTMSVYTLAAALDAGISVKSTWDSPALKAYPGRTDPVHDYLGAPCQPVCSLSEAVNGSLNVPLYAVAQKVTPARVLELARSAGIDSMWVPASPNTTRQRYDLKGTPTGQLTPSPFGGDVGLGAYPVTVEDQANAMATFAAGGVRAQAHFVAVVRRGEQVAYREPTGPGQRVLNPAAVADLAWVMSQEPAGHLAHGVASAAKTGVWALRNSAVETAHAWLVGFTSSLAMAIWVGNVENELPLRDSYGARVTGSGLPAQIYQTFMNSAVTQLGLTPASFAAPTFGGDQHAGNATRR
jgi:membrane peptidoglycan carboxypeptidase